MKARRESRLRALGPTRTDTSPHSFFSTPSPQTRAPASPTTNVAFPSTSNADAGEDFIVSLDATAPHPMPRSLDNGATLDWSGKEITEEPKHDRKWSLSIPKRRAKDKTMSTTSLDHPSLDIPRDSNYDGVFIVLVRRLNFSWGVSRTRGQDTRACKATDFAESFRCCRIYSTPLFLPICIIVPPLTPPQPITHCSVEC